MGKDGSCERIMPLGLRERERGRERGELVWLNSVIGDRGTVAG
jgi:hypothetical protein